MSENVKTLREKVKDDTKFLELYSQVGLPNKTSIIFKGRHKKATNHTDLGMTRQYSKYLNKKGLVYNSISK